MENKFNYVDQNLGRNIIKVFIFPDVYVVLLSVGVYFLQFYLFI